ncbi:hypothetical protein GJ744_002565 [Endocarpon pusillum]|uniref:Uncharacterized protein n=1 Tax=Endocarpon pusillum TaxID=364733 RepID=A0A8H7A803_9EURO|nr:hypothetical protein GJ744_002565 [Endocarpon pusillum]
MPSSKRIRHESRRWGSEVFYYLKGLGCARFGDIDAVNDEDRASRTSWPGGLKGRGEQLVMRDEQGVLTPQWIDRFAVRVVDDSGRKKSPSENIYAVLLYAKAAILGAASGERSPDVCCVEQMGQELLPSRGVRREYSCLARGNQTKLTLRGEWLLKIASIGDRLRAAVTSQQYNTYHQLKGKIRSTTNSYEPSSLVSISSDR